MTRPISDNAPAKTILEKLKGSPKLSEEAWKPFSRAQIEKTPARRRPLVRYLLFCCNRKCLAWPGDDTIGRELGYCERSVRNHLNEIEKAGIIQRIPVPTRFKRVILFPDHPGFSDTLTSVQHPAKFAGHVRQNLPDTPGKICRRNRSIPVPVQEETGKERNSRVQAETPEKKNLSNGTGTERPGDGLACPHCDTPTDLIGISPATPEGTNLRCNVCGIVWTANAWNSAMAYKLAMAAASPKDQRADPVEFLKRLRPGAPSSVFEMAATVLCATFAASDTGDYSRAYRSAVRKVERGGMKPAVIVHAFQQAMLPSADNPGRVFAHNVNHRITKNGDGQAQLAASKAD
jgi:hypothetical protein